MGDLFTIQHLLLILLIVVLVFGTKKLKSVGADLGGAVKGFKEGMAETGIEPGIGQASHLTARQSIEAKFR